jgi:hypothetical protein
VTLEHNAQVVAQGQALPIYDLRTPKFLALLGTYLEQIQQLEDAIYDVFVGTMLPGAAGDALDMLGELVGQPRAGRDDETYKIWISARVMLNSSSGRPPDILGIARTIMPPAGTVLLTEYFPGAFKLELIELPAATTAVQLHDLFNEAKAAGVRIDVAYSALPIGEQFTLGAAAVTPDINVFQGFSDIAQTTGGALAGVV